MLSKKLRLPIFIDPVDQTTYPLSAEIWRSASGSPLMVEPLAGITRKDIIESDRSIWRYRKSLPVEIESPVSLGEGCSPLIAGQFAGLPCHFKLEWFSPTGSFKDRGASVLMSFLKQQGVSTVIEDSSGNAGASIAGYSAAAGIHAKILVPASIQPAKVAQIKAYGAEVILVPGPREATEQAALAMASENFYASHNWHPLFLQGTKSLGYEIWEDLGFCVPDNIVIPTGAGSNLLGCHLAFLELLASAEIEKMPRLFVSQPANCCPVHHCFQARTDELLAGDYKPTVAEGTALKKPIRLKQILGALSDTNGGTVTATESEIIDAGLKLARSGIYVEPTCAHAASAFQKLIVDGTIKPQEKTVVMLTGTGLKATAFYAAQFDNKG